MNKSVFKILTTIVILLLAQILTFFFFGKKELIKDVQTKSNSFLPERPFRLHVVYCNCNEKIEGSEDKIDDLYNIQFENTKPLSGVDKFDFIKFYSEQYDSIKFISNLNQIEKIYKDPLDIEYSICFYFKYPFLAHVYEGMYLQDKAGEGDSFETARSKLYVWFFLKWIEVGNVDWGSS